MFVLAGLAVVPLVLVIAGAVVGLVRLGPAGVAAAVVLVVVGVAAVRLSVRRLLRWWRSY